MLRSDTMVVIPEMNVQAKEGRKNQGTSVLIAEV